jgi:hypothetical protein
VPRAGFIQITPLNYYLEYSIASLRLSYPSRLLNSTILAGRSSPNHDPQTSFRYRPSPAGALHAARSVHFGLVYWRSLGLEYRASWRN